MNRCGKCKSARLIPDCDGDEKCVTCGWRLYVGQPTEDLKREKVLWDKRMVRYRASRAATRASKAPRKVKVLAESPFNPRFTGRKE